MSRLDSGALINHKERMAQMCILATSDIQAEHILMGVLFILFIGLCHKGRDVHMTDEEKKNYKPDDWQ